MKIEIPKITQALKLSDYAPEFGEGEIIVWVNPPRKMVQDYVALVNESDRIRMDLALAQKAEKPDEAAIERLLAEIGRIGGQIIEWYAELWGQGPEETRWSTADIEQLIEGVQETDPQFWPWLTTQSQQLIRQHRGREKKG